MSDMIRAKAGRQRPAERDGDASADPDVLFAQLLTLRDDPDAWGRLSPAPRAAIEVFALVTAASEEKE